jgi:hypothetical protein
MAEAGGPTNQVGIFYQNSVAAQHLADLLNLQRVPPRECVVEVRVEALAHVDDIVVLFADGHREWVQAKSNLRVSGASWQRLWTSFAVQAAEASFGIEDRLVIALGTRGKLAKHLQALVERASTSQSPGDWHQRLGPDITKTLDRVTAVLPPHVSPFELFRIIEIRTVTQEDIENYFQRLNLGTASALPKQLLSNLRDLAGGSARLRGSFRASELRKRLVENFCLELFEPSEWGLAAYRGVIQRSTRIEIPGRGISAPVADIVVWPRVRRLGASPQQDFEDETPTWDSTAKDASIDISQFPSDDLERCVIVAGPGFGKSTVIGAIAANLLRTPVVPVEVSLGTFAQTEESVVEYLESQVNRNYTVRVDWRQLAEKGLVCVLFDGLDEVPTHRRADLIKRIGQFSSRFQNVRWLLSVRDPGALNGPLDAELIELLPFDNTEISKLAAKFRTWNPNLDAWEFTTGLQAYPDLAKLARIPLFLSIVLASWSKNTSIPRRRSDLIELYLRTLFDPGKRKSHTDHVLSAPILRAVAEAISFTSLEREEIGLSERQCLRLIAKHVSEPSDRVLEQLLSSGILRRHIDGRLQFPYPIVQEYLAAVHLAEVIPDQIAARIGDVTKRPWAQVMQFALELVPNPSPLIRAMRETADDAFSTGLRLIGRCIVNGTAVDSQLYNDIGSDLAKLWGSSHYNIREKVGGLVADGFSAPLHPEVRHRLGWRWLLGSGAGEIVTKAADPNLTRAVVDKLLEGSIEKFMSLRDLQVALQAIASDVVQKVTARAQREDISTAQLEGLAEFLEIIRLDKSNSHLLRPLANDEKMPIPIRFAAHAAMADPPDQSVLSKARNALSDEYWLNQHAALRIFERAENVSAEIGMTLTDPATPEKGKAFLIESLSRVIPDKVKRGEVARSVLKLPNMRPRHQNILRIFASGAGDRKSFVKMIDGLDKVDVDVAQAVLVRLNLFPEKSLGELAKDKIAVRKDPPSAVAGLVSSTITGLTYIISHDGWDHYGIEPAQRHPSFLSWMPLFDNWLATPNLTKIQRLRVVMPLLKIRPELIGDVEKIVLSAIDPDAAEWDEDKDGHTLRGAMDDLRRRRVQIPFALAEAFALANRANLQFAGIGAIETVANSEALERLISIYQKIGKESRSTVFSAIEVVASRLNVRIMAKDLGNIT